MNDIFSLLQKYTGISKYSISEVITPQNIVKYMVDLLPSKIFNQDTKFLDPAVKSGRFLAEVYHRLFDSPMLADRFPNEADRRKHILENQLYGLATSETAATIVRKQLYGDITIEGNVHYIPNYLNLMADKGADFCKLVEKEFGQMKFDVVIGNPPYQDGKRSIYHNFINSAVCAAKSIVCMITNSNWFGRDEFKDTRKNMIDFGLVKVVDFPKIGDVFDSANVPVAIFLLSKGYDGETTYIKYVEHQEMAHYQMKLSPSSIICRSQEHQNILEKVQTDASISKYIKSSILYGITTNFGVVGSKLGEVVSARDRKIDASDVEIFFMDGRTIKSVWTNPDDVPSGHDYFNYYKVICGRILNNNANVLTSMRAIAPGQINTQSFGTVAVCNSLEVANAILKYVKTKFARFMCTYKIGDGTNNWSPMYFEYVPDQDFTSNSDIDWSQPVSDIDKRLYEKYGLTQEEMDYIEATINPMD